MAFPDPVIQSRLPGFLALLGIQNTGINPPRIGESVAPVVDLRDWYLRGQEEWLTQAATLVIPTGNSNGITNNFFTVPTNEYWYVRHFTVNLQTGAADTVTNWAPAVQYPSTYQLLAVTKSAIAASFDACCSTDPFWIGPGGTLSIYVGKATVAASLTLAGAGATITRMKVG